MVLSEKLTSPNRLGLLAGLAVLGSGALLAGALWFQYVMGLAPCEMCHWQRWPHMVAVVAGLGALAMLGRPRIALALVLTAIAALVVTAGIGVFHAGVENHWWAGPQACSGTIPKGLSPEELRKYLFAAKMVRCDEPAWKLLGISMAGWNAIASAGLAVVLAAGLANALRARA
jgi:disulfide bond formation protein DsbB